MLRRKLASAALFTAVLGLPVLECMPAYAAAFSSAGISYENALLSQFNLVTIGNLTQTAGAGAETIAGRTIVGGTATFVSGSSVCITGCTSTSKAIDGTGASFGALTVFGNLVAPATVNNTLYNVSVGSGDVSVGGKSSGNIAMNRASGGGTGSFRVVGSASGTTVINATGVKTTQSTFAGTSSQYSYSTGGYVGAGVKAQVSQTMASVFPFSTAYQTAANDLRVGLSNLPGSPGVTTQTLAANGNNIFFTAQSDYVSGGKSYGVVTTTLAALASQTNFLGIDNGSNEATFVIVTGDGDYTLPNLNSYAGSNRVIFDFVNATTLKFAGNWSGSILAPLANITSMGGTIDGSVIVNSINQTQALYATNLFVGDLTGLIPEPTSIALIGAGLAALGIVRRRRRS